MKIQRRSLACLGMTVWMSMGCDSGGAPSVPSCDQVCSSVSTRCGLSAPQCPTVCASFTDDTKRCIVNASSCAASEACLSAPTPDAGTSDSDAGTRRADAYVAPSDAGSRVDAFDPSPCGNCGATQYCVVRGGPTGCWSPPASCTEACASCLDAALFGADGPCPSGTAPGCESSAGSGRVINCI